jgi:hypothetical protein
MLYCTCDWEMPFADEIQNEKKEGKGEAYRKMHREDALSRRFFGTPER